MVREDQLQQQLLLRDPTFNLMFLYFLHTGKQTNAGAPSKEEFPVQ